MKQITQTCRISSSRYLAFVRISSRETQQFSWQSRAKQQDKWVKPLQAATAAAKSVDVVKGVYDIYNITHGGWCINICIDIYK